MWRGESKFHHKKVIFKGGLTRRVIFNIDYCSIKDDSNQNSIENGSYKEKLKFRYAKSPETPQETANAINREKMHLVAQLRSQPRENLSPMKEHSGMSAQGQA